MLFTQDFSTDARDWFQRFPQDNSGIMVQKTGFTPPFGSDPGVGEVVMSGQCPCPTRPRFTCPNSNQPNSCRGPTSLFGQTATEKYWKNFTQGTPFGFVVSG